MLVGVVLLLLVSCFYVWDLSGRVCMFISSLVLHTHTHTHRYPGFKGPGQSGPVGWRGTCGAVRIDRSIRNSGLDPKPGADSFQVDLGHFGLRTHGRAPSLRAAWPNVCGFVESLKKRIDEVMMYL